MTHILWHVVEHSLLDTLKLVPFLFITYLVMEYLEHKAGEKTKSVLQKTGRLGPALGAVLGVVPQCGFSAAASGLYAGRVITTGTLLAIFLSTSDEMLPIMISAKVSPAFIGQILLIKVVVGMVAGFLVDLALRGRRKEEPDAIHSLCEEEHCHCEEGIVRSALRHTVKITVFILLITLTLNLVLELMGEDILATVLRDRPVIGPVLSALVGLIPNCASSVVITRLYLEGAMSCGTMLAGLLAGAGTGVLVLFRVNHSRRESLQILLLLYAVGVLAGIVLGQIF